MKSTNYINPQFWGKRKPLDHVFKSGHVEFSVHRNDGKLYYGIYAIKSEQKQLLIPQGTAFLVQDGVVKDEAHLKQLLSIKSLAELPNRN